MLQKTLSTEAFQHIAWFELRNEADYRVLESNLSDNNPPTRVSGQLYLDAEGAPSDVLPFDIWRDNPYAAGPLFRVSGNGLLVMLGWSWDEAKTPGGPVSRRIVEKLHPQARDEWVDEAAEAIAAGRDGHEVEAALIDRWHARRRNMFEHDGRPLVASIDLIRYPIALSTSWLNRASSSLPIAATQLFALMRNCFRLPKNPKRPLGKLSHPTQWPDLIGLARRRLA
jgi:hypothetical protein